MKQHLTPHGDSHTLSARSQRRHTAVTVLLALLILANLFLIFFFSAENGEESGNRSAGVTDLILGIICPEFDTLPQAEQQLMETRVHHAVRKIAHFLEYALLGFLTACLTVYLRRRLLTRIRPWQAWVIPATFCLLYAISDEVHQIFSGRGPRATDVLIDFSGAVFGVCVAHGAVWIIKRMYVAHKSKKGKETDCI
jgi:VanZ family protein